LEIMSDNQTPLNQQKNGKELDNANYKELKLGEFTVKTKHDV